MWNGWDCRDGGWEGWWSICQGRGAVRQSKGRVILHRAGGKNDWRGEAFLARRGTTETCFVAGTGADKAARGVPALTNAVVRREAVEASVPGFCFEQ